MVVPDVVPAARFCSSLFNPDMQKEKDAPLRYYVMTGTGYIAIGARAGVTESKVDHYCTLVRGYNRDRMNETLAKKGCPRRRAASCRILMRLDCSSSLSRAGQGPRRFPADGSSRSSRSVKPVGFDSILLKVTDVRRSSEFYSHFFDSARARRRAHSVQGSGYADRSATLSRAGEKPGMERYTMRVAAFDRAKVVKGLAALGAKPEEKGAAGVVRFSDPNGLGVAAPRGLMRSRLMNFLRNKRFSRRTFLQGAGVCLSLPLLESMAFAGTGAAQCRISLRLGFYFVPHGAVQAQWRPEKTGALELQSDPETAGAVPQPAERRQRSRSATRVHRRRIGGGESFELFGRVPQRRPDAQERQSARRHRRSARRAAHRAGLVAAVPRARHRGQLQLLRRGLELRVPRHDLLAG